MQKGIHGFAKGVFNPKVSEPSNNQGIIYSDGRWINANVVDYVPDFIASGASHSRGLVPDPGAVSGTAKALREDSTWQSVLFGSGVVPIGNVIAQFDWNVYTFYTQFTATIPFDNTIPTNSEAALITSVSITPKSSSSTIVVVGNLVGAGVVSSSRMTAAIFRSDGSGALSTAIDGSSGGPLINQLLVTYSETSGSTSSRTYELRGGVTNSIASGAKLAVNGEDVARYGGSCNCFLLVVECLES